MTEGYTHVLIVEDDAQLNAVMRQTLELERFGTVTALSGEEGWSHLVREQPGVAIVDLGLPGDSGWSLIQRMRGDGRFAGIPILVVTGDPDEHIEERAHSLRCGVLRKPFEPATLITRLREVMVRALQVVLFVPGARIQGTVHGPPSTQRFSDAWQELCDSSGSFLPVTGATILSLNGEEVIEERPFLSVAKDRIWAVYPIEGPELGGD